MQYLSSPTLERREPLRLADEFGKHYAPEGEVLSSADVLIEAPRLDILLLDGETLVIQPDTVSWAFLTRRETAIVNALSAGRTTGWLQANWPDNALGPANDFVARLFRRGLVKLQGQSAVDESIFEDSPNVREGHLVELLLTEK